MVAMRFLISFGVGMAISEPPRSRRAVRLPRNPRDASPDPSSDHRLAHSRGSMCSRLSFSSSRAMHSRRVHCGGDEGGLRLLMRLGICPRTICSRTQSTKPQAHCQRGARNGGVGGGGSFAATCGAALRKRSRVVPWNSSRSPRATRFERRGAVQTTFESKSGS